MQIETERLSLRRWQNGDARPFAQMNADLLVMEHIPSILSESESDVDLDELVSFTVPENTRSRQVMERIGMTHDPSDDFDHPRFPDDERMERHVLYRLRRSP